MVGMASVEHLVQMIHNESDIYEEYRNELWDNETQKFRSREDVTIWYGDERHGHLTVGYGSHDVKRQYEELGAVSNHLGPELGFGIHLGDTLDNDVILIKAAWGGRDLAVDFRPPSSGEGSYLVDYFHPTQEMVKPSAYGGTYRDMVSEITKGLENIHLYYPNYNAAEGYDLAAMIFFQGYNDVM